MLAISHDGFYVLGRCALLLCLEFNDREPGIDLRKFFWSVFGRSHMINDSQSWVGLTNFRDTHLSQTLENCICTGEKGTLTPLGYIWKPSRNPSSLGFFFNFWQFSSFLKTSFMDDTISLKNLELCRLSFRLASQAHIQTNLIISHANMPASFCRLNCCAQQTCIWVYIYW